MAEFLKYAIKEKYRQMNSSTGEELKTLRSHTAHLWKRLRREHRRVNFGGKV